MNLDQTTVLKKDLAHASYLLSRPELNETFNLKLRRLLPVHRGLLRLRLWRHRELHLRHQPGVPERLHERVSHQLQRQEDQERLE